MTKYHVTEVVNLWHLVNLDFRGSPLRFTTLSYCIFRGLRKSGEPGEPLSYTYTYARARARARGRVRSDPAEVREVHQLDETPLFVVSNRGEPRRLRFTKVHQSSLEDHPREDHARINRN